MHLCSFHYHALWIFIHSHRHQMHSGYAARLSLILFIMGSQFLCFWEHVIVPFTVAYKITSTLSLCHYSIMSNVNAADCMRPFSAILNYYSTHFFFLPVMDLKLKTDITEGSIRRKSSQRPPLCYCFKSYTLKSSAVTYLFLYALFYRKEKRNSSMWSQMQLRREKTIKSSYHV